MRFKKNKSWGYIRHREALKRRQNRKPDNDPTWVAYAVVLVVAFLGKLIYEVLRCLLMKM